MLCYSMINQSRERKIAITVWDNRVSPVFDAARTLLFVTCTDNSIAQQGPIAFDPQQIERLIRLLLDEQVRTLICGAISQRPAMLLESAGIELIPFISGPTEKVFTLLQATEPQWSALKMPGCGRCCTARSRLWQL